MTANRTPNISFSSWTKVNLDINTIYDPVLRWSPLIGDYKKAAHTEMYANILVSVQVSKHTQWIDFWNIVVVLDDKQQANKLVDLE